MISISCPSRGRPELAKRMIDTAYETAASDIQFLIYLNDDDPMLDEYQDTIDKNFNDPKITVSIDDKEYDKFLEMAEKI